MQQDQLVAMLHRLADAADGLTLAPWQAGSAVEQTKTDGSVVTDIDSAVETELRAMIRQSFPDDAFLGEEVGATAGTSGRTWIVDGIDGTRFYARGDHEWSTLISLVVEDTAAAGIVTSPALDRRWWTDGQEAAISIGGARPEPLAVSASHSLDTALVGVWPWEGRPREELDRRWTRFGTWPSQEQLRPSFSTAVPNGAMLVADGRADAFVLFGGRLWDHAANVAIVRAAGGQFSCLDGSDSMSTGAGVYSNGLVHDALLDRLAVAAR